jgi:hypothetical protein
MRAKRRRPARAADAHVPTLRRAGPVVDPPRGHRRGAPGAICGMPSTSSQIAGLFADVVVLALAVEPNGGEPARTFASPRRRRLGVAQRYDRGGMRFVRTIFAASSPSFSSIPQRETFNSTRARSTSHCTSHDAGATWLYQGQVVAWLWQLAHAEERARVRGVPNPRRWAGGCGRPYGRAGWRQR